MSTIETVLKNLPTKIVSQTGNNFYLILEMGDLGIFTVFYRNSERSEETEGRTFISGDKNAEIKVEEMLTVLEDLGFRVFSPKIDEEFRTRVPRLPI